ncbi:MAG: hypothetical protein QS748_06015 [Candidatus Endonucleobacter bathymodioli]|uniref:Uncharacterized protein n=1 Tax=Candidatus Endonucleibacter bathymodioli TaxID=539814 RepID=A0AA90NKS5_9GAMM|nr:hypothetical protein [Candidatus Endonucleobacter bathymodioli]
MILHHLILVENAAAYGDTSHIKSKCSSEGHRKVQETPFSMSYLSSVASIVDNRKDINILPVLIVSNAQCVEFLFAKKSKVMVKETSDNSRSCPLENNQQSCNPAEAVIEAEHSHQSASASDVSEQGSNNLKFDSVFVTDFTRIINANPSVFYLAIILNPSQVFYQISDNKKMDLTRLRFVREHPYFKDFNIYLTRYGSYDNSGISIDFKPKNIDQYLCNISRLENEDIVIPQSGKEIVILCESIKDEFITIVFTNKKPVSIKKVVTSFCFPIMDFIENGTQGFSCGRDIEEWSELTEDWCNILQVSAQNIMKKLMLMVKRRE